MNGEGIFAFSSFPFVSHAHTCAYLRENEMLSGYAETQTEESRYHTHMQPTPSFPFLLKKKRKIKKQTHTHTHTPGKETVREAGRQTDKASSRARGGAHHGVEEVDIECQLC